jgi:hypothetical protein
MIDFPAPLQGITTYIALAPLFSRQFLFEIVGKERPITWLRKFIEKLLPKHS